MIEEYLENLKDAKMDPRRILLSTSEFMEKIRKEESISELLSLYSTAQQLEVLGVNTQAFREAVRDRASTLYGAFPFSYHKFALSLNLLMEPDGLPLIEIKK